MIANTAIENFLNRKLDNYDWLKDLTDEDLDEAIAELEPNYTFANPPPFKHQKACFLLSTVCPEFLFLLDMGLGKSRLLLDIINYRKQQGYLKRALVLVPNLVNITSWENESLKFTPNLKCIPLYGSSKERDTLVAKPADINIINYGGLVALLTDHDKRKKKQIINQKKLAAFCKLFDVVVFDESTALKARNTLTYRVCAPLAKACQAKFALTGTPFGRQPLDLWPQFYIIDGGETLGQHVGMFRSAYFNVKKNFWGGVDFTFKKNLTDKLNATLKNKSIRYNIDECIDLPGKRYEDILVSFPIDTYEYYKGEVAKIINAKKDYSLMENAFSNMRQLASGFLYFRDGITKERIEIQFPQNPKLDALEQLISEMPDNCKMIVVHEFIKTGEIISNRLKKLKIKHSRLWSGTKDKTKVLNDFINDKSIKVFVMNHASGGKGLNLQVANYLVFFESPVSPIDRQQTERRTYRPGQDKVVLYYNLIMKNSVDEKISKYLEEGKNLFDALVEGKESWV